MKKFSFVFALALACVFNASAEWTVNLNPYAYGVTTTVKNGKVAVGYQLNAPATKTEIVIFCDGTEVAAQEVADNAKGLHNAVVDLSTYTTAGTYTIGIRVTGTSVEAPTQVMNAENNDTTFVNYGFDHPKGVDVDVNPFSPNFGRLIAAESYNKAGSWYSEGKCGIYAFDPTFSPMPNGNDRGYNGGIAHNTYSPYRVRIAKDGRIFATSQCDEVPIMWEISADLTTWTPFFVGSYAEDLSYKTADGDFIASTNCGLDVDGEGENLQLLTLSANRAAYNSYAASDFFVAKYNVGTATSWNAIPSEFDTLAHFNPNAAGIVVNGCNIASDHEGGFWYKAGRADAKGQHGMFHVNAEGVMDWTLADHLETAADSLNLGINKANGNNGGAGIRVVGDMLYVSGGFIHNSFSHVIALKITKDAAGAPVLTKVYDFEVGGMGRWFNDLAIDYANNMFTVGNNAEMLVPVVLPYSGVVVTPTTVEHVVEVSALEDVTTIKAEKIIENGQVIVIKNGVRYNVLGAQL